MGSEGCTNQAENSQATMPTKPPEKSDETVDEKANNPLGPITPDSDRENGDFPVVVDFDSPRSSAKEKPEKGPITISPHTPKEGVFDPFAPGPEAKALAPQSRKFISKSRNIVARRLSFESSIDITDSDDEEEIDDMSVSDEEIVEAVYESLLETIVSKQTEAALLSGNSECVTPPNLGRLTGITETCPGAPVRPGAKSRKIDPALCRRLQFSP